MWKEIPRVGEKNIILKFFHFVFILFGCLLLSLQRTPNTASQCVSMHTSFSTNSFFFIFLPILISLPFLYRVLNGKKYFTFSLFSENWIIKTHNNNNNNNKIKNESKHESDWRTKIRIRKHKKKMQAF